jgi:hypothetical protein
MKQLFSLLFVFIQLVAFGQADDSDKENKISIGIIYSPDYCFRILKPDDSEMAKFMVDYYNTTQSHTIGFTSGLSLNYKLNKKIQFESGILLSEKGYKDKRGYEGIHQYDPYPYRVYSTTYDYLYFIEIPLKVNYFVTSKKIKIYFTGGVSNSIFFKSGIIIKDTYADGTEKTINHKFRPRSDIKNINLATTVGFGFFYSFTNRLSIRVEPTCRYFLTSDTKNSTDIKEHLYSFGINTGIFFNL